MESENLLPPWGLVENFTQDKFEYLPMQGALNACFESISAYHLLRKSRQESDELYAASMRNPLLRRAASVFYKPTVTRSVVRPWLGWLKAFKGSFALNRPEGSGFLPERYKLVGNPQ